MQSGAARAALPHGPPSQATLALAAAWPGRTVALHLPKGSLRQHTPALSPALLQLHAHVRMRRVQQLAWTSARLRPHTLPPPAATLTLMQRAAAALTLLAQTQTQCASQAARTRLFVVHSHAVCFQTGHAASSRAKAAAGPKRHAIAVGARSPQRAPAVGAGSCSCLLPSAGLWSSSSRQRGWQRSRGSYQSGGKRSRMSRTRRKAKTLAS